MNTPEVPETIVNPLLSNNANIYHSNHMSYQNLSNGQYTQSQLDSRYPAQHPNINNVSNTNTKTGFDMERLQKSHNQTRDHNHSNSDSSSDSDDSNNDSDSSSADSDAEKNDKEIEAKRVVKPFRLNLTKVCTFIRRISIFIELIAFFKL